MSINKIKTMGVWNFLCHLNILCPQIKDVTQKLNPMFE
jgi:hypothetical protein